MFKREILNEIARCLNMPYNIAACNSLGLQLRLGAAGPPDLLQVHPRRTGPLRGGRAGPHSRRLAGRGREGLRPGRHRRTHPHQWFWDGHEHVDPPKEATAQATRLASNTTTLAAEYARQGKDWETELRQRAKEVALMKELGLTCGERSRASRRHRQTPRRSRKTTDEAEQPQPEAA